MLGTGTQDDPYIVDNWDDFVTALSYSGAYIRFPDGGGEISMNDVAPDGLTTGITVQAAEIDGNGWIISELHIKTGGNFFTSSSGCLIKNLHFERVYGSGTVLFYNKFSFSGCTIQGTFDGVKSVGKAGVLQLASDRSVYRCAVVLECNSCQAGTILAWNESWCARFEHCTIDITARNSSGVFTVNAVNSYITGDIDCGIKSGHNNKILDKCVINAYIRGTTFDLNGAYGYVSVINSDRVDSSLTIANVVPVTTEQLKNAAYLNSIGFTIGVV